MVIKRKKNISENHNQVTHATGKNATNWATMDTLSQSPFYDTT